MRQSYNGVNKNPAKGLRNYLGWEVIAHLPDMHSALNLIPNTEEINKPSYL